MAKNHALVSCDSFSDLWRCKYLTMLVKSIMIADASMDHANLKMHLNPEFIHLSKVIEHKLYSIHCLCSRTIAWSLGCCLLVACNSYQIKMVLVKTCSNTKLLYLHTTQDYCSSRIIRLITMFITRERHYVVK